MTFKKGQIPWNKDKKHSEKTCKKMREARLRFFQNGGISWMSGKKGRQPWMNTTGLAGVNGNPPWNKGGKHTAEAKRKMSQSHKRFFENGGIHGMSGKKHSEETKKHWSKIRKGKEWRRPETVAKVRDAWSKRRGAEVPTWKGGITPLVRCVRTLIEYKLWREHIFQRDNYICLFCKQKGGRINADHIIPFSVLIQIHNIKTIEDARKCSPLWDIRNGRTLCESCHRKTDTFGYGSRKKKIINCLMG